VGVAPESGVLSLHNATLPAPVPMLMKPVASAVGSAIA